MIFLREDMLDSQPGYSQYNFEIDFQRKVRSKINKLTNEVIEKTFTIEDWPLKKSTDESTHRTEYSAELKKENVKNFATMQFNNKSIFGSGDEIVTNFEVISIPQLNDWFTPGELFHYCGELIFRRGADIPPSFSEFNIIASRSRTNILRKYIYMQIDNIEIID